jgi:hypothetical protein
MTASRNKMAFRFSCITEDESCHPKWPIILREFGTMQDLLWIGVTLGLLAATLAYVRLCDLA